MGNRVRKRNPKLLSNRNLAERVGETVPEPEEDSPGDSADDELEEIIVGKEFNRDGLEESEETPLAEEHLDDGDEQERKLDEDVAVESSPRPDPIEDIDSPSSTH